MKLHSSSLARSAAGLLLIGLLASACRTAAGDPSSHWNVDSVDNRIVKRLTGYKGGVDGSYARYQAEKKRHVNLTLRRHFLNQNPENPFQVYDPEYYGPAKAPGLFRDPISWFGFESIAMGFVTLGWTGTFVPVPVDSIIALFSSDGSGRKPPKPSTFKVKHR